MSFVLMGFLGIVTVLGILLMCGHIGSWSIIILYILLGLGFFQAAFKSSYRWRVWIICVVAASSILAFISSMTKPMQKDGEIQLVSTLYPIYPTVYAQGVCIDTIDIICGYSTYAGWFYRSEKAHLLKLTDSSQVTTILSGKEVLFKGKDVLLEEYEGEYGPVTLFSYTDIETGVRVRRDYYDRHPDDQSYTPHVRDDADYILNYNM